MRAFSRSYESNCELFIIYTMKFFPTLLTNMLLKKIEDAPHVYDASFSLGKKISYLIDRYIYSESKTVNHKNLPYGLTFQTPLQKIFKFLSSAVRKKM